MGGKVNKIINHVLNECCRLAHKVYQGQHDWVGRIHWEDGEKRV